MHFLGGKRRIQLISMYYAFGSWEEANSTISRFSFFLKVDISSNMHVVSSANLCSRIVFSVLFIKVVGCTK